MGTPKTLDEAILSGICIGPIRNVGDNLHNCIKDFMSQKFTIAMFRMDAWRSGSSTEYTPEEILRDLFNDLTRRQSETKKHD